MSATGESIARPPRGMPGAPGAAGAAVAPAEKAVARIRRHARVLFWPSLLLVVACAAAGYFVWGLPETWMKLAVWSGLAAIAVLAWLVPVLWWMGQRSTITTRRVIVRSGFLVRVRQEVALGRVYEVSVRRSWLQSLFRSGDVLINLGSDKPVVLRDVPRAGVVQRALHDLVDRAHETGSVVQWQSEPSGPLPSGLPPSGLPDQRTVWGGR